MHAASIVFASAAKQGRD